MDKTTKTFPIATILQQPRLADLAGEETIEGIYRISHVTTLRNGTWTSTLLRLRDASRTLECVADPRALPQPRELMYRAVKVHFTSSIHPKYGLQGRIVALEIIDLIPEPLVLDLLPRPKKIAPLIDRLRRLLNSLSDEMCSFSLKVLTDDTVTRSICTKPASLTYHHAEYGGQLRHAVEMAERIGQYGDLAREEREIAQVAALFHDIGKTQTLDWKGRRTSLGKLIAHESLILSICDHALRDLRTNSRHWADLLCHIWTAAYRGQYGIQPQTPLVQVVRDADRNSAIHDKWLRNCMAEQARTTTAH